MQELYTLLHSYLKRVGIDSLDCNLILKPYSSSFFGRYNPNNNTIILYVCHTPDGEMTYTMWELFKTLLHEYCHFLQWSSPDFVRHKGVMHNAKFWEMYNNLVLKASRQLTQEEKELRYHNVA